MSHLHPETLSALVGDDFFSRLRDFSELILLNIKDSEVRSDTRMAYAANRLARTPIAWQDLNEEQHDQVVFILRESIGTAVKRNPDKFSLWRSALRVSLIEKKREHSYWGSGLAWLTSLLKYLADAETVKRGSDERTWQVQWPWEDEEGEKDGEAGEPGQDALKLYRLKASFVRAQVLREFSYLVQELEATQEDHYLRTPMKWHSRFFDRTGLSKRVSLLPKMGREIVKVLYPGERDPKAPWEERSLVELLLSYGEPRRLLLAPPRESPTYEVLQDRLRTTDWARFTNYFDSDFAKVYLRGWKLSDLDVLHTVDSTSASESPLKALEALLCAFELKRFPQSDFRELEDFLRRYSEPVLDAIQKTATLGNPCGLWLVLELYKRLRAIALRYSLNGVSLSVLHAMFVSLGKMLPGLWALNKKQKWAAVGSGDLGVPEEGKIELKRLLWSVPNSKSPMFWSPDPAKCPAIGLPRQSSLRLFQLFLDDETGESGQRIYAEPVLAASPASALAEFRNFQFYSSPTPGPQQPFDGKDACFLESFVFYPHPLVLIGQSISDESSVRRRWAASCAYLLAVAGDETLLEILWRRFPFGLPPSERLVLQSSTLASDDAWVIIDSSFNRKGRDSSVEAAEQRFKNADFHKVIELEEIVDLRFRETGVRGALSLGNPLPLGETLYDKLIVRMAQINKSPAWGDWKDVLDGDFELHLPAIMDLEKALPEATPSGRAPSLLLVPEIAIPTEFLSPLKAELRTRLLSLIGGLYWRKVPAVAPISGYKPALHLILNQALVHLDFSTKPRDGYAFSFNITKPNPAHTEYGLAKFLSMKASPDQYFFARGYEWYRFCHQNWGPFTVAICSDLLDAGPWSKMKGHLLHLFLVAYNTDVSLYDAATWTRAYELYVNLAAVNHGSHGGSLAWSPQQKHDKTIVRLEGANQFLLADVELPIKDLLEAQKNGQEWADAKAREEIEKSWFVKKSKKSRFKSIPPGWKHHW